MTTPPKRKPEPKPQVAARVQKIAERRKAAYARLGFGSQAQFIAAVERLTNEQAKRIRDMLIVDIQ